MLEKFKACYYNKYSFTALRTIPMVFHPYPEGNPNPNFVELEKQILAYWEDNKIFKQSIANRRGCPEFVFYDGPPFANGMPHYGHLLTGFAKDAIARFQTMLGKKVERRFGWDCHGLPAEMSAEKELNISGKKAINQFGIAKFNQCCKDSVMRYANSWRQYVNRQARWVDFDNDYKTMDTAFMESVIWGFKELYKKGLVYKSTRVMPYSWACETPLSNFETRMDNAYRQKISKAATICFKARHPLSVMPDGQRICFFIAWTTTPWTLPSNLALAVHRDMQYTAILHDNNFYICALSCAAKMAKIIEKNLGKATLTDFVFSGESLLGTEYLPQFDFFTQTPNAFRVLHGDFVSDNDGTGIVHCAPGFGEDDLEVCLANKIPVVCPIDDGGRFTKEVPLYQDKHVFDTNDSIIMYLKQHHLWLHTEQYLHQYPHCWRTDTPLIYRALPSWYIKVTAIKDRMVELNQSINWLPAHIRDGLFGKWLENARDWSVSRKRFWGTPIPIWESDNPAFPRIDVYGSIDEIEQDFKTKIPDLHRPFIDQLVRANPDDPSGQSQMRRVEDVFDCWFESGSMPYAQKHYPFENKQWFHKNFPADFIVEYVAQTRGWFYTLMVLSTALFDSHPFKNCICHGVVLDQKGQKLSKRLNNYTDPLEVMEKYGSDALRFLMLSSSIMSGGTLLLDKDCEMVRDALRLKIKPIWNAYCFFAMYANTEQIAPEFNVDPDINVSNSHKMDFYILNKCKEAVRQINECLSAYDTVNACAAIEMFFEVLNNWYIRRNKKRFIEEKNDDSKQNAYNTLYSVLHVMCRAICPLVPFVSECVYKNLTGESVHLQDFPVHQAILATANAKTMQKLNDAMDEARDICNAALSVRNAHNIRIRQPLNRLTYFVSSKQRAGLIDKYMQSIIEEEVNVKEFAISYALEEHAKYKLQMVFAEIGKRIPENMKDIIAAHKKAQWQEEPDGLHIGNVVLQPNEYNLALEPLRSDVSALSHNHAVVMLDTTVDEDLLLEGIARDLVRLIQETRKQHGFRITDKVVTHIVSSNKQVATACHKWSGYIKKQTYSIQLFVNVAEGRGLCTQYKLMDDDIGIFLANKNA